MDGCSWPEKNGGDWLETTRVTDGLWCALDLAFVSFLYHTRYLNRTCRVTLVKING